MLKLKYAIETSLMGQNHAQSSPSSENRFNVTPKEHCEIGELYVDKEDENPDQGYVLQRLQHILPAHACRSVGLSPKPQHDSFRGWALTLLH